MKKELAEFGIPWSVNAPKNGSDIYIVDKNGKQIAIVLDSQEKIAKRIAHSVNACRSANADWLAALSLAGAAPMIPEIMRFCRKLSAERDQLLEACKAVVRYHELVTSRPTPETYPSYAEAYEKAKAAIEKTTEDA